MPLTNFQREVLAVVGRNRTPDSYLAGGAAIHFTPTSLRFSNDLDFFNDSVERVASAFATDSASLGAAGFVVEVEISQPGSVRSHCLSCSNDVDDIGWRKSNDSISLHPLIWQGLNRPG